MNDLNQHSLKNSTPKPTRATPKKTFTILCVITVIIFVIATLIVTGDDETLDKFSAYEGRLTEIKVTTTRRDQGKPATPIMVFTIDGLDAKLGIGQNAPADYSIYTNNLKVGDKIKVYYDSHPYLTPEGYNPFVYQLEREGVALLDINELNRSYKRGGYIGFGIGILLLVVTIIYYRNNVAKKIA